MDTDELTEMAYETLRIAAGIADILKCELGAMSAKFHNEDEYLRRVLKFIVSIETHPEEYLDFRLLLDDTDISLFKRSVTSLKKHAEDTLRTPLEKRGGTAC